MTSLRRNIYTAENFLKKIREANDLCTKLGDKPELVKKYRANGLKLLKDIISKLDLSYVEGDHVFTLVWCCLALIEYFHFNITAKECVTKIPKKKRKSLEESFDLLTRMITKLSHLSKSIYATTLTFLTDASLWKTECLCADIIKRLLISPTKFMETMHLIFDSLEKHPLENEHEGRVIIRVFCRVLEDYNCQYFDIEITNKILIMYYNSVRSNDNVNNQYTSLTRGLENCIKTIIKNVNNQHVLMIVEIVIEWALETDEQDNSVYDFSTILQYASIKHDVDLYCQSLNDKLLENVIRLIESPNSVSCLLGHKILQNLLDRNKNVKHLEAPRIYFREMTYDITTQHIEPEDKVFIKKHRYALHGSFMSCIKKHGKHRGLVETVYTTLALLLLEVKCGFTAASVACLAMNIQEYVLSPECELELTCSHRIHAMVISILSLVCWVYDAQVFYDYLYDIMKFRAYAAPFLNPPIHYSYQYAEHNILWNKKELFFEDWQVRYGIWNCFRPVTYSDNMLLRYK